MKRVLVGSLIALLTVGGRSSASSSQVYLDFRCDQPQKVLKFSLGPHLTGSVALQGQEFLGEIAGTPFRVPTSCFNNFTSLLLDDFNFDGVRDLAAETSVGYMGVNQFYRIYFVNPRSGQMRPSRLKEVSQGMADPLRKVVITQQKSGPGQLQQVYCLRPDSSDLYLCRTGEVGPNAKGPSYWDFTWQTPQGKTALSRAGNQRQDEDPSPELTVTSHRAYFHTRPDSGAQQSAYVIRGDKVEGLEVKGNWIRVAYRSKVGRVTVGWLALAQLR